MSEGECVDQKDLQDLLDQANVMPIALEEANYLRF
jgi:hypothetical protein